MDAASSSKTLVTTYHTVQYHKPENNKLESKFRYISNASTLLYSTQTKLNNHTITKIPTFDTTITQRQKRAQTQKNTHWTSNTIHYEHISNRCHVRKINNHNFIMFYNNLKMAYTGRNMSNWRSCMAKIINVRIEWCNTIKILLCG